MKCNVQGTPFYLKGYISVHHQPVSRGEVYEMGFAISLGLFTGQYPQPGNPGEGKKDRVLTLTSGRGLNNLLQKDQVSILKESKIRPGVVTLLN